MEPGRRICDYEETDYRGDFWESGGRQYEDRAERIALRRLLPRRGRRLLDLGAGYGRLSEFYAGYDEVVLLDYSLSLLRQARERLGANGRVRYVAASLYEMPFAENAFDAVLTVRVLHHVGDVPALLGQVASLLHGSGSWVLEFANKRHLKAIGRYALRRQTWSPFDPLPFEFADTHFDFHPAWLEARLAEAMFHVKRRLTVSHFRVAALKRIVPAAILAALDGLLQPTGRWWQLTPSVFLLCRPTKPAPVPPSASFLRCPRCGANRLCESAETISCERCASRWPIEDGIYCFKTPLD